MLGKINYTNIIIYSILSFVLLCVAYPLFLLLINSFKDISEFYLNPLGWPKKITFDNYIIAYEKAKLYYAIPNSLYLILMCEIMIIFLGSLAAYPIARIKLEMNQVAFRFFLAGMIIPAQVIAVPVFVILRNMNLLNNLFGVSLILTASLLPLTIFIYSGFYKTIPYEIEEAAKIDGCGTFRIFFTIIFPLSRNATATVVILTSLDVWREFFFPLILVSRPEVRTLSVALFSFENFQTVQWTNMFAAMMIMMVPIMIVFLIGQSYFIKGINSGALKG